MKNTSIIYLILTLYIIIISISTLVLLSKSYKSKELKNKYFEEIEKNFSKKTIKEIKIQKTECSDPKKNLLNLEFSGTEIYCNCSNGINYIGRCNLSETKYFYNILGPTCKYINVIENYLLHNIKKIYLCAEFSDLSYSKIKNLNSENKNCEKGFKICGKDSKEFLCFPEELDCPINDIIISNTEKKDLKSQNYKEQKIENNFYLYTTNKKVENPLVVDFKLGYENICIDPNEEIAPIKQFQYYTKNFDLECETELGENIIDSRYKKIYSLDKYKLYRDNKLLQFLKKLPNFDNYSLKYNLDLFTAPYFHFSYKCFEKLKNEDFLSKIDIIKYLFSEKDSSFNQIIVSSIVLVSIILTISIVGFFLGCFNKKINIIAFFGILIFCNLLFITVFVLIIYMLLQDKQKVIFLHLLDGADCGDFYINELILEKKNTIYELEEFYTVIISLLASVFFCFLIYVFLFFCCKKKLEEENKFHEKFEDEARFVQLNNVR